MTIKKRLVLVCALILSVTFFTSCNDDDKIQDNPPKISVIKPANTINVKPEASFDLEVKVTDDVEIKSITAVNKELAISHSVTKFTNKKSHTLKVKFKIKKDAKEKRYGILLTATDSNKRAAKKVVYINVKK
ncbi:hypothetical protein [Tenacibaculum xiamenense]|uniref:hypothetical protein n=1 Tax=Tenacibaculum xiamenense TaxID=1261553 RepID=UPI0038967994